MMSDMMDGAMSWMMTGMGALWLLIVIALVLGVVALAKYVFFK
jgi:hypothetical protein